VHLARFPVLDGLRGFAAVAIVVVHYSLGPALRFPWIERMMDFWEMSPICLDSFLILSGFLIGTGLLATKDSPSYYQNFYRRRIFRIFPIYFGWLALFCLLYFVGQGWGLEPPSHIKGAFYLLSFAFFFQNFFPSIIESSLMMCSTWTLAVEEHFYLLAPICIRRLSRRRLVQCLLGVILAAPVFRAVLFEFIGHRAEWADIATRIWSPCRADALALGVLLAIFWDTPEIREWLQQHVPLLAWGMVGGSSLAMFLEYATHYNWQWRFLHASIGRSAVELASLSLIIFLICRPQSIFGRFFGSKILCDLGKISYSLYVIHWGVLWIIFRFVLHRGFGERLRLDFTVAPLALLLSIAIARLSWQYFEYPLMRKARGTPQPASDRQSTSQLATLQSLAAVK
jgi:peptidoglycan/LPS O-acetylase OafA/YrhL